MKKAFAFLTAVLTGIPNAGLTMIFFFVLIGNLSNFMNAEIAIILHWALAILIGIGFVTGEGLVHMDSKDKGFNFTMFTVLIAMGLINIGAGHFRADESARLMRSDARILVKNDPRFTELQKEKEYLQKNVLNDGLAANDAAAMKRMEKIDADINKLSGEYVGDAHVSHMQHNGLISIFFVAVNLLFGLAVRTFYQEKDQPLPFRLPAFWFTKPKWRWDATEQPETESYEFEDGSSKKPVLTPGFQSQHVKNPMGFGYATGEFKATNEEKKKEEPSKAPEPIIIEKTETEIIDNTLKLTGGLNLARTKALFERFKTVKATLGEFPNLSNRKQAEKANMPEATFRGLKNRIKVGELTLDGLEKALIRKSVEEYPNASLIEREALTGIFGRERIRAHLQYMGYKGRNWTGN